MLDFLGIGSDQLIESLLETLQMLVTSAVIGAVIGGGHDGFFDPGFWNFGLSVKFHF